MRRLLRFGIVGLLGISLVSAVAISSSKRQNEKSSDARQPQNSSSAAPIENTKLVFEVCSKKNPPPCAKPPHAVFAPEPEYSDEARKAHYRGFSTLKIIVETDGRVSNVRVVGHAGMGLDENAVEAVKRWKFDPGTRDGKPVPVEITVQMTFNM